MAGFNLKNGRYVIDKSTRADLDYGIRLKSWLIDDDTVSNSSQAVWELSAGLQKVTDSVVQDPAFGPIAYVKVKGGGAVGTQEWARCTWTTNQGRVETQTLFFNMVDK